MRFVGVDLAWGDRNPSGLVALDAGGRVTAEDHRTTDAEIASFVAAHDPGGAVVAFDAPLVVANQTGARPCEAALQRRYGRLGAGPYPTSLGLLGGRVRAMDLVRASPRPYLTVPSDPRRGRGWWAIEVFPHPALVELGDRSAALRYKKGPAALRAAGLGQLYTLLLDLAGREPPLRLDPGGRLAAGAGRLGALRGRARKAFEDLADAHVCAYVALWWWWHGPAGTLVAGDDASGAILVPRPAGRAPADPISRRRGPARRPGGPGAAPSRARAG